MEGTEMDKNEAFATTDGIARKYLDKTKLLEAEAAALREQLADCMTEIQTAHVQIDQWNFGIPTHDEERELSLSQRISDLCRRLVRAEAERDDLRDRLLSLAEMSRVIE